MSFIFVALVFAAAALVHGALARAPRIKRVELVLVYLLAGYHGVVMMAVALVGLLAPEFAAAHLGATAGSIFQQFAGFAFLGMSVASLSSIWLRGSHLIGQVIGWTVFFYGATYVHLAAGHGGGHLHGQVVLVLAHALMPTVMIGLVIWRGVLARPVP